MAREAGAKKVYFASCAPPIRYPNVYGIDMPTSSELVAYNRTVEQVADYIGADRLIYQRLEDLIESCRKFNGSIKSFDVSVFNGQYVSGDVSAGYLKELEHSRGDQSLTDNVGNGGNSKRRVSQMTSIQQQQLSRQPSFDNGCGSPANVDLQQYEKDHHSTMNNHFGPNHGALTEKLTNLSVVADKQSSTNNAAQQPYYGPDTETMGLYNSYGRPT